MASDDRKQPARAEQLRAAPGIIAQHVRMDVEWHLAGLADPFKHAAKPTGHPAVAHEYVGPGSCSRCNQRKARSSFWWCYHFCYPIRRQQMKFWYGECD
jgi:hypothetical protein